MTLKEYIKKRNLTKTPEPKAKSSKKSKKLHFVVQKHDARRLHYDFRLEYDGVLLSWAVPKGPSLNPNDKRLAVHVEDHPLEYRHFEGVIPKGNYGAGTVEIWDKGYYIPESDFSKGLKKGHLSFTLYGEKLEGIYDLIRIHSDPKNWLLIKRKTYKMPDKISPMLATLIKEPFNDPDWLFEIKWDGFRALAYIDKNKVQLKSRNNQSFNEKFNEIAEELQSISQNVILDGEIVVLDKKGNPQFHTLQNYHRNSEGYLCYYVFDLLHQEGELLVNLPLIERKERLKKLLESFPLERVRYSDHILEKGIPFFKKAAKKELEGIIAKKSDSHYQFKRSKDWLKIKTHLRQEVVIAGFTEPQGSRDYFGSLVIGVYDNKELLYVGNVGGGFNQELLKDTLKKMKPYIQKKCPFKTAPKGLKNVTWIKPLLVAEVSFAEWTQDNRLRQPIFQGLREDKDPKKVKREATI